MFPCSPNLELQPPVAEDLAGGLQHLLAQALSHEFPAAPDFETDVNKTSTLQEVYQYAINATRTANGRVDVRPKRWAFLKSCKT